MKEIGCQGAEIEAFRQKGYWVESDSVVLFGNGSA